MDALGSLVFKKPKKFCMKSFISPSSSSCSSLLNLEIYFLRMRPTPN